MSSTISEARADPPMHILSISPHFSINGVTVHVERLNSSLRAAGHRVTWAPLATADPRIVTWPDAERVDESAVVEVSFEPLEKAGGDWFSDKLRLVQVMVDSLIDGPTRQGEHPAVDLVHSHDWLAGLAGDRLARRLGCRHLTTIHTLTEIQRQRAGLPGRLPAHAGQIGLERALCTQPDAIITVSEAMRGLIASVAQPDPASIEVIPNGIDPWPEVQPTADTLAALRRRLAPGGERIVLFVGRLAPQKGVDFLLRSTFAVRSQRPDTRWIVVGDHVAAHMMRPVYERVLEAGGEHVSFLGEVSRDEVEAFYRVADCLVVPSLYEGCPYVILEGMRAGVPIVASNIPCFREILDHGRTGLLVPLDETSPTRGPDASHLARAQLEILGQPSLGERLAAAARDEVQRRFPVDLQLARTVDAYYRSVAREADGEGVPTGETVAGEARAGHGP